MKKILFLSGLFFLGGLSAMAQDKTAVKKQESSTTTKTKRIPKSVSTAADEKMIAEKKQHQQNLQKAEGKKAEAQLNDERAN